MCLTNLTVSKYIKRRIKLPEDNFHNILRFFDVSTNFSFTIIETITMLDYYL